MNSLVTPGHAHARKRDVARLAEQVGLPFRSRAWRGSSGAWQGRGQGSSVDFQDHRAYMPGDDPRHLDWAAYARTNNYTMKLFREEVSPRLDVVLDVSRSMVLTPEKEERRPRPFRPWFCMPRSTMGSVFASMRPTPPASGAAWRPRRPWRWNRCTRFVFQATREDSFPSRKYPGGPGRFAS